MLDSFIHFDPKETAIINDPLDVLQHYIPKNSADPRLAKALSDEAAGQFHANRLASHQGQDKTAAMAQALPFAANTIDVAIDVLGPLLYLRNQQTALETYLSELARVLRPIGIAYLYDADPEKKKP